MGSVFLNIFYLIFPAILCYYAQSKCKVSKSAGDTVAFRPPSSAFGIIWPILFVLLGLSWMVAMSTSTFPKVAFLLYFGLAMMLSLWIVCYGCIQDKKNAIYILGISLAFALGCFACGNELSKTMIAPLIAWSIYAIMMNAMEIQMSHLMSSNLLR